MLANPTAQVAGGFFRAEAINPFELAMGATVLPLADEINPATFLPGSRSVAFRKRAWEAVGGYNEWLSGYGFDDADFYIRLRKNGIVEKFIDSGVLSAIEHSHELRSTAVDLSDEFFAINITKSDVTVTFQDKKNTFLAYLKRWSRQDRIKYQIAPSDAGVVEVRLAPLPPEFRTLNAFANFLGLCFISGDQRLTGMLDGMMRKLISEDVSNGARRS